MSTQLNRRLFTFRPKSDSYRRNLPSIAWLLLAALLFMLPAPFGRSAAAQSGLEIQKNSADVVFPEAVRFALRFKAAGNVEKVTLIYSTNAQNCHNTSARQNVDFEADGDATKAEWTWNLVKTNGLPPGARLTWQWEILTSSGGTLSVPAQELPVEDSRYNWQKISEGAVTVYWSEGNASFGRSVQQIGINSLAKLSQEMGIDPPANVRLMVYPDASAVQAAGINMPDWTGGFAVPEYGTVMLGIYPDQLDWARTIIPHELAHLISDQRTFNCKGATMPTWLSEGISVVAEGEQDPYELELVTEALSENRLPSLRSLSNGFAANSQRASLAYAQSGMLVRYFIETYGSEGMDALLQAIQDGKNIDRGLQNTIGLDTDGLDAAWRSSLGYAPAAQPDATATSPAAKNTPIPTLALWTQAAPAFTPTPGPTEAPPTPAATTVAVSSPTPTPATRPASSPPAWPIWLAGAALLIGGIYFAIRRTFRR